MIFVCYVHSMSMAAMVIEPLIAHCDHFFPEGECNLKMSWFAVTKIVFYRNQLQFVIHQYK